MAGPGRPPIYDWDQLATDLFDLLFVHRGGLDGYEIGSLLGLPSMKHTHRVIRYLRLILGDTNTVNVVIQRTGHRYIYILTDDVNDVSPWSRTRMRDQMGRLESLAAVWHSQVSATDGRTLPGKVARHVSKYLDRMLEDVRIELGAA